MYIICIGGNMKKIIIAVFIVCFLMLIGCTGQTDRSKIALVPLSDEQQEIIITPIPLSDEQQEIMRIINNSSNQLEILLFYYTLNDSVTKMEVWVDVYHYGELQEDLVEFMVVNGRWSEYGNIAIIISRDLMRINEFHQSITISNSRPVGGSSYMSVLWTSESDFFSQGAFSSVVSSIQETHSIELGQEIILRVSKFTNSSIIRTGGDLQRYLHYPELLAEYTYVHLIKVIFR